MQNERKFLFWRVVHWGSLLAIVTIILVVLRPCIARFERHPVSLIVVVAGFVAWLVSHDKILTLRP